MRTLLPPSPIWKKSFRNSRHSAFRAFSVLALALALINLNHQVPEPVISPVSMSHTRKQVDVKTLNTMSGFKLISGKSAVNAINTDSLKTSDWYSTVLADINHKTYKIDTTTGGKAGSINLKQGLRTGYSATGFTLASLERSDPYETIGNGTKASTKKHKPFAGKWALELSLKGLYADGALVCAPDTAARPEMQDGELSYNHHGLLTVQYQNSIEGVRQNFIVQQAPVLNAHELRVALRLSEGWQGAEAGKQELHFSRSSGNTQTKIIYKDLNVWDADGKKLTAVMEGKGQEVEIVVASSEARYPITIDPISSTPAAILTDGSPLPPGGSLGMSVSAAGDVNGDGKGDIIVGVPDIGAAYVYYGSSTGLPDLPSVILSGGSQFGYSVATAGDVNGDGVSDVIVGAAAACTASVFYGSASGLSTTPAVTFTGISGDQFGQSVACAGDVNGDGKSDVIVGAPVANNFDGAAYIFYGTSTVPSTTPSVTLSGIASGGQFGISVAGAGDVNGDGISDVIVGAPMSNTYRGAAYIYYGNTSGLSSTPSLTIPGVNLNDQFGHCVASAGDVNGDGKGDIIVGANTANNATGSAHIFYGSASGPSTTPSISLTGFNGNDNFGISVASAGDLNGDGKSDVIVGACFGNSNTGGAYIYYGSASGPSNTPSISLGGTVSLGVFGWSVAAAGDVNGDGNDDFMIGAFSENGGAGVCDIYYGTISGPSTTPSKVLTGVNPYDQFAGSVAAAGDVNGDGIGDVIVGVPGDNNNTGAAYIYYGSASGLAATPSVTLKGTLPGGNFGFSVATAGDVNGDGKGDIIIGAYNENSSTGAAYVYYGSSSGPSTTPSVTLTGINNGDKFGYSVASAGDINGDGKGDVIVGAIMGNNNLGAAYIFYGSGSGLGTTAAITLSGASAYGDFGNSVANAGDLNGDGKNDIIVGAPYENNYNGVVYVFYGSSTGLSTTPSVTLTSNGQYDYLGGSVAAAGDVNGDGVGDIIAGAAGANSGDGAAYVYFGSSTGLSSTPNVTLSAITSYEYFGTSVSGAGDVNGDGIGDLIVGNYYGNYEIGAAYIYYGSTTGISTTPSVSLTGINYPDHYGVSVASSGDVNGDGGSDIIIGASGARKAYSYLGVPIPNSITTGTITGSPFCAGSTISVPYTTSGTFNSGNIFTAELSDASGSFSTPLATATGASPVSLTIPANVASGSGYMVRVSGSNPVTTGSTSSISINALPAGTTITATNSICQSGCTVSGGSFNATACTGTTLVYYTDATGSNSTKNTPAYNQTGAMTIYYACVDNSTTCASAIQSLTTVPGACTLPADPGNPVSNSPQCLNAVTITAIGTAPSGETWYWEGTNASGTSTVNDASTPYSAGVSGTYYLRARNNSSGCWSAGSGSIAVVVSPSPQGTLSANGPFCGTGIGQLTFTSTSGTGPFTVVYNDGTSNRSVTGVADGSPFNVFANPVTTTQTYTLVSVTDASCTRSTGFTGNTSSIIVNSVPDVTATPGAQSTCNSTAISTIVLSGNVGGTTFNWTRNNSTNLTGISSSGSGNISGTMTNTVTGTNIVAETSTFTITPATATCTGTPVTAAVTVNPSPDVTQPGNQVICNNNTTVAVPFSGATANTIYNWTNSATSIGLAANGSGSIPSFTGTNTTGAPVTATITVTPSIIAGGSSTAAYAYITNNASNTVSVINTANNNALVTTIAVQNNPIAVSVNPDGTRVYVTNYGSGSVSVINTNNNTVINNVSVGSSPYGVVISPDGSKAYVSTFGLASVAVINTANNSLGTPISLNSNPYNIAISPDGNRLYVSMQNTNQVAIINTTSNAVSYVTVGSAPKGICVSPDGTRVYVANYSSNSVSVINTTGNAVVTTLSVGTNPWGISCSPDGSKVFVSNFSSNNVSVITTASNAVSSPITVGSNPIGISFTADGTKAYIANYGSNSLSVINTVNNTVAATTVPVGNGPYAFGNFIQSGTNCNGSAKTFTITVNPGPVVQTVTGGGAYCSGGTGVSIGLSNSQSGVNYQLMNGAVAAGSPVAGTGSPMPNAFANQTAAGSYTIVASQTAAGNCTSVMNGSATISINPLPTVSPVSGNMTVCTGSTTQLSDGTTGGVWSSSTPAFATVNASGLVNGITAGSSVISYTVTDANSCSAFSTSNVIVNPKYAITASAGSNGSITPSGITNVCSGSNQTYTIAAASNYHLVDVLIDGVSNGAVGSYSFSNVSSTHTISASFALNCTAPVISCNNTSIAKGTDAGLCTAVVTYTAATATGTSPVITYSKNSGTTFSKGVTTVVATATNACGSDQCSFTVTVTDNQAPVIASGGPTATPASILANVPEAAGYRMVYALDIPNFSDFNTAAQVPYTTNNAAALSSATFNRIAYYMQLDNKWVWVSANKFTSNTTQLGVPIGYVFQQNLSNMNVVASSNSGISTQNGITTGNIEFWDNCYSTPNSTSVPGASGTTYDFGDQRTVNNPLCYGSMQIHNYGAQQTLFAYNCWTEGTHNADIGIGSQSSANPDWTFTYNSGTYTTKKIYAFIDGGLGPITANTDPGQCFATLSINTPTATDNCGTPIVTGVRSDSQPLSAIYPTGTTTITWTADDGTLTTSATQIVTVTDNINPTITAPPTATGTTNNGCTSTNVVLGTPVTGDNCTVASVTNNAPASFPKGNTTVTWTVKDAANNIATATQLVTVTDNINPTITAPAATTGTTNAGCTSTNVVLGTPATADNCTVATVTNNAPASFPIGNTTVTWTAKDGANNIATATQLVTVTDNIHPTIIAPATATGTTNAGCTATNIVLGTPVTADNCSVASVTNNAPLAFPLGNTTVTWTVTDGASNTATATQLVTVTDNTNPTITAPPTAIGTINSGCTSTNVILGTPVTADNCTVASVTNNAPASFPIGNTTVTWTVKDGANNIATATQLVTVTDIINPTITAPAATTGTTNAGCTSTNVVLGIPVTADNCTVASVTNDAPASFPIGNTTVTWTVTDGANNIATATQLVTVTDNINPSITAPAATTGTTNVGCTSTNVVLGTPVTSDNCSVSSVFNDAPSVFPYGTTLVTWTVKDGSNNTATATQTVTVTDNQNPVFTSLPLQTVTIPDYCQPVAANLAIPGTSDNCGVASVVATVSGNLINPATYAFAPGSTTVVWTVTDIHGRTATANQVVTVTPANFAANLAVAPLYPMSGQEIQTIYLNYPASAQSETITSTPSGGTAPFTYNWTKSNCNVSTLSSYTNTSNVATFSPTLSAICSGNNDNVFIYTVNVADAHGCTATAIKKLNVVNAYVGNNIQVCHKVSVRGASTTQLITVSPSDIALHIAHGDGLGNCPVFTGAKIVEPELSKDQNVVVYPNPTTGVFIIELSHIDEQADIVITDVQGKLITHAVIGKNEVPTATFNIANYAAGMYLIQVLDSNLNYRAKIILK